MRRVAISGAVALLLVVLSTNGFAKPPFPLTACGTITQRGNYIFENDLVTSPQENCLVISSSHVNVDLNGRTITCLVPGEFPLPCSAIGDSLAGIGIDIEADHVSISNGRVENYGTGIVGTAAEHISATNLSLATFAGIVLNDVSYSNFANIAYEGVYLAELPVTAGPVLSAGGGGRNTFESIKSSTSTFEGIIITNSSNNIIEGANVSCSAEGEAGPGIILTQDSNRNLLINNNIFVLFGNGIELDSGDQRNFILNNTVTTATTASGFFALLDQNPNCGSDIWINNNFSNLFASGQMSASPASCIH